jgi:hypothetical protein
MQAALQINDAHKHQLAKQLARTKDLLQPIHTQETVVRHKLHLINQQSQNQAPPTPNETSFVRHDLNNSTHPLTRQHSSQHHVWDLHINNSSQTLAITSLLGHADPPAGHLLWKWHPQMNSWHQRHLWASFNVHAIGFALWFTKTSDSLQEHNTTTAHNHLH